MNNKKIVIATVTVGKKDVIPDFGNVKNNPPAQEYLLRRSKQLSREKLFEEVYQNCQLHGAAMMEQRASSRKYQAQKGSVDGESSYLNTLDKELDFYDLLAKEDTRDAMNWLEKELQRQDKVNSSLHPGEASH